MALAAAQVIDALAARLVPLAATGGRVYTSRAWPLSEADLPAWKVTAEDEAVSAERGMVEPINLHELIVNAKAIASATADLDDTLHALAAGGLALLFAGTVPHGMELRGLRREMSPDAEAKAGAITLQLRCRFWVNPATPESIYS
jgi:hypothetical protein